MPEKMKRNPRKNAELSAIPNFMKGGNRGGGKKEEMKEKKSKFHGFGRK